MALIAPLDDVPALAEAVIQRLSTVCVSQVKRWPDHGGNVEFLPETLPTSPGERMVLFERTLESRDALIADCLFRTFHETEISIGVWIQGRDFLDGHRWKSDGPLIANLKASALAENFLQDRYGLPPPPAGTASVALDNVRELFCAACGLLDKDPNAIRPVHASLVMNGVISSPGYCAMVYHRDVGEFAHDVRRTWLALSFGASPAQMWWKNDETHWVTRKQGDPFDPFRWLDTRDRGEMIAWLRAFNWHDVQRAEGLDEAEIAERLKGVEQEWPEFCYIDCGSAGVAIMVPPFDTLWRAYRALTRP